MGRYSEIQGAFRDSIRQEQNGRRTVTTADFIANLEQINYIWTLDQANRWIEHQQYFRDITPDHGNNRVFQLFNPNGPY